MMIRVRLHVKALLLGLSALGAPTFAQDAPAGATTPSGPELGDFVFAALGDAIGPVGPVIPRGDPNFARFVKILKSADVGYANEEGSIFDIETFHGYAGAENGGGTPLYSAPVAKDYKAMGIDMMSKANNHAVDWGPEGLLASGATLRAGGVAFAGSGPSLADARAPAFYDSPKGRVALVSIASTFPGSAPAGPPHPVRQSGDPKPMQAGPGPGISVLHTRKITLVTPSQMNTLREIGASVGMNAESSTGPKADLCLGEQCFRVAAGSTTTGLTYTMDRDDESAVLQSIREAKQTAKAVVFAIHAHETAGGSEDPRPADFLPVLFHEAIDAGATIVIRTGPHSLQGIEVYKGKPIFYGMGSVFFTPGADGSHRLRNVELPARWYDSAVAITIFHRGKLSEIRIYPLTLVSDGGPMASTPRPAAPVDAQRILTQLQQDSLQFGTHLQVEKGVGIIRP